MRAEASLEPTPSSGSVDPLVGQTLAGRFKILALIDRGGMGKIYRAEQMPLGRIVALKTLDIADHTGEFKTRFFREASVCSKLSHPNTVRIFDYGNTDDGVYFLVMEFLEGRQLHQAIAKEAPFPALRAIAVARQIAAALAEAHDQGVIHRDLKPQNVFLVRHGDEKDFVKVVDFGLVKELGLDSEASRSGNVLGSPMYMAPEQVEVREIDQRADVYALGLILYVMLCGQTPYERGNSLAVMMQQIHKDPPTFAEAAPKVKVLPSLEWIVRTAIAKQPDARFANMRELSRALKAVEREVRREVGPIKFALQKGRLVLPPGLEVSEEHRAPAALPRDPETSQSIVHTMTRPAPLAAGIVGLLGMGVLGVALLGAIIGILALVMNGQQGAAGKAVVAAPVAPVVAPVAPAVVEAPAVEVPAIATVTVSSEPAGAEVAEGGAVIGNTPLPLKVKEGEARTLEVSAPGRVAKTVRVDGAEASVLVRLAEVPKRGGATKAAVAEPVRAEPVKEPAKEEPKPAIQKQTDIKDPFAR